MLLHTGLYLWQYPAEDPFPLVLLTIVPAGRVGGLDLRLAPGSNTAGRSDRSLSPSPSHATLPITAARGSRPRPAGRRWTRRSQPTGAICSAQNGGVSHKGVHGDGLAALGQPAEERKCPVRHSMGQRGSRAGEPPTGLHERQRGCPLSPVRVCAHEEDCLPDVHRCPLSCIAVQYRTRSHRRVRRLPSLERTPFRGDKTHCEARSCRCERPRQLHDYARQRHMHVGEDIPRRGRKVGLVGKRAGPLALVQAGSGLPCSGCPAVPFEVPYRASLPGGMLLWMSRRGEAAGRLVWWCPARGRWRPRWRGVVGRG